MRGETFKLIRKQLGQSIESLAELLGVDVRTIRRWENNGFNIPSGVIDTLDDWFCGMIELAEETERQYTTLAKQHGGPDLMTLLTYRDQSQYDAMCDESEKLPNVLMHHALVSMIYLRLSCAGVNCEIVEMDDVDFLDWLDERANTQATRSEWATEQIV